MKQTVRSGNESSQVPWHSANVDSAIQHFGSDLSNGLSVTEIESRLLESGPNELVVRNGSEWYEVLGRQFTDALVLILVVAAIISALIGALVDATTIMVIVVLNGTLGFVQEWKAERAILALKTMLAPKARVRRDGHARDVDARTLVPGDVIILDAGDRVPADIRLATVQGITVDESALTGESQPVRKSIEALPIDTLLAGRATMTWMGTVVSEGRGVGVVVATGMQTEFGRIANLTGGVEEERTPLQRKLLVLGRQLGLVAIFISTVVALVGWLVGNSLLEMFMTGVSLAVAVVPEGLPAVVTITLALGIRAMVKRNVLLRRLPAIEAIGSATVICSDKTGTLTQNEMTAVQIWQGSGIFAVTGAGYDPAGHFERDGAVIDYRSEPDLLRLLETGQICNHAETYRDDAGWHAVGDPTEAALDIAAKKAGLPEAIGAHEIEFGFTSDRKRMTVVQKTESGSIAHSKGAPEAILPRCTSILIDGQKHPLTAEIRDEAICQYRSMASSGQRTLALGRRDVNVGLDGEYSADAIEKDLTLLGIVGIEDPPRQEVPAAVKLARRAGIRIIMITGDAPETALAVAKQIGLQATAVITGAELSVATDSKLDRLLDGNVLFARTDPEHKLRIVTALKNQGEIVAMTGDGVNDAPALKKADIGIAMGKRGTDVAQGASDIVLTDDNFASIVGGVEEGRRQYNNIQKFVRYLLASNTGEVLAVFGNILVGGPLLLLPVQILWMNLVTDGLTAVALGVEPVEDDVMARPPREPKTAILGVPSIIIVLSLGVYLAAGTLFLFHYFRSAGSGLAVAQTVAFTGLVVMEKVNVFNFRSLSQPITRIGMLSNRWLLVAVTLTLGLQIGAVYVPLLQVALSTIAIGWDAWLMILIVAAPVFVIPETIKWVLWRRGKATICSAPDQITS